MAGIKKIVVIGPESTGKSTLSCALAAALHTVHVPEYARAYLTGIGRPYQAEDLLNIGLGQLRMEDELAAQAREYLICDTDLYVIKVWAEESFGQAHRTVLETIANRKYDCYLLTYIDVAWEADPLREHASDKERHYFYHQYRDIVINSGVPWAEVRGTPDERLRQALAAITQLTS